ncbi:MAG: glycosyltransferase [candidate division Zixibacteria bacterium]|nr:glycosyltransferase [candidate division Zixibacteria bacterium]
MRKIKILHLITDFESGGAQIQLLNTLKRIDGECFECHVAFILGKGSLSPQLKGTGVEVFDLTNRGKFTFTSVYRLYSILRKLKIDILHTHLVHASLLGRAVAPFAGVRHVLSTRHFGYDTKENNWIYYLERKTCHLDSAIVAVSAAVRRHVLEGNPRASNNVLVIENGVEIKELALGPNQSRIRNKFRIVSVGRLHRIKRFDVLVKAVQMLRDKLGDFEVLIVGEGENRKNLEALISDLGVEEKVELVGDKPNIEVLALLRRSDLYVQCSDWEGFGLAVAEAMAQSLPVIAASVGGLKDLINTGVDGLLIPPSDPAALADSIERIANDSAYSAKLGGNARKTAKSRFNLGNSIALLEQLYRNMCSQKYVEGRAGHEKIRVMQIITRLNVGGAARHVIVLASRLNPESFDSILISGKEQSSEGDMMHLASNATTINIPELQRNISPLRDLKSLWAIYKIIRQFKPHIVHCHTSKAGVLGRVAAKLAGVPITIYTYHGHIFGGFFSEGATRCFLQIEKVLSLFTTKIISISRVIYDDLSRLRIVNGNGEIIENGFDLDEYVCSRRLSGKFRQELSLNKEHILIGAVGRFVPTKGWSVLLVAAHEFLKTSSRIRLVLVGDGELKQQLLENVHELGIEKQVIFTGFQNNLVEVYSDLDIFVLPSIREGMPTVLIEAICSGVPVVATNVDAVPELVNEETGLLVNAGDSTELSAAISMAIHRLPWQLDSRTRSRYRDRFNSMRLVKDFERLYKELVEKHI